MSLLVSIRRKSKQALRDYKKVQIQLENLETSVRDRCKKEFTGKSVKSKREQERVEKRLREESQRQKKNKDLF